MADSPGGSRAICILGMHRSGTSTVARALNLLGADLGAPEGLMEAAPDNPEGYWERWEIWRLHERVLAALRSTWDSALPPPENWQRSAAVAPLREELVSLIAREFAGHPLWAWKDPRSALLLPLWLDALGQLGIPLSVVFVTRNPLDVARSLQRRDGIGLEKGLGMWFSYTVAGLRAARGLPTVFVPYDRFLGGWEAQLRRCAAELGIPWPAADAGLRAAMAAFVRPELRHSASTPEELRAAGAPPQVVELHGLLALLEAQGGALAPDPEITARLDALATGLAAHAGFYREDLEALWEIRRECALERELCRQAGLKVLEAQQQIGAVRGELERAWSLQGETARQLAGREAQLAGLEAQLAGLQAQLAGTLGSWSWRATSPARWIHRKLTRG